MGELDARTRTINRLISLQDQDRMWAMDFWKHAPLKGKQLLWQTVNEMCEEEPGLERLVGCFAQLGLIEIELAVEAQKGR